MEVKREIISQISNDKVIPNDLNEKTQNMKSEYYSNKFSKEIIQEDAKKKALIEPTSINVNLEIIDRKKSSDSTSNSISQIENLSQTSESSQPNSYGISSNLIFSKDSNNKEDEEIIYYYYGTENYFFKIMPEKFSEYKKTKNYFPKNEIIKNEEKIIEKDEDNKNIEKEEEKECLKENEEKKEEFRYNQNNNKKRNNLNYQILGNMFYYNYNLFYFNCPYMPVYKSKDLNLEKIQNKMEKNYEINEPKFKEIKVNKYDNIYEDEQDVNIYIIERQPSHKKNNKNNYKEKKQKKNININANMNKDLNLIYNNKNYNFKYKNYNNKKKNIYYKKNNNNQANDYYYKNNEKNYELKRNYYNHNNKKKTIKVIYY